MTLVLWVIGLVLLAALVERGISIVADRADGSIDETLGRDEHEDGFL